MHHLNDIALVILLVLSRPLYAHTMKGCVAFALSACVSLYCTCVVHIGDIIVMCNPYMQCMHLYSGDFVVLEHMCFMMSILAFVHLYSHREMRNSTLPYIRAHLLG